MEYVKNLIYGVLHVMKNDVATEFISLEENQTNWLRHDMNWASELLTIASEKGHTHGNKNIQDRNFKLLSLLVDPIILGGYPSKQQLIIRARRKNKLRFFA